MKKIFLLLGVLIHSSCFSQTFQWVGALGGSDSEHIYDITVDDSGNIYTTGTFEITADLDPGPGVSYYSSAGGIEAYVSKSDASGGFIWAKTFRGLSHQHAYAVVTDPLGNVYVGGAFRDTVDFDPGVGIFNLASVNDEDAFVCKLDAAGNFVWVKSIAGVTEQRVNSMAIDASGNIYLGGEFRNTADFDPGPDSTKLTSMGQLDAFICKLDASGNFIWAKSAGGIDTDENYSLATDGSGSVYSSGIFDLTVDFDPGPGTASHTSAGVYDGFILKLDSAGNFVWVKTMGGISYDAFQSIVADGPGNLYMAGTFRETVDLDPGPGVLNFTATGGGNGFVGKLNPSGDLAWVKCISGSGGSGAYRIAKDGLGNIYTVGGFTNTVYFDSVGGAVSLTSTGGGDGFITKLDTSGNFFWAADIGGPDDEYIYRVASRGGSVYGSGSTRGTTDFDPGPGTFNLTVTGPSDAFLLKLDSTLLGISDPPGLTSFLLYPDPASDHVVLRASRNTSASGYLLTDMYGKTLFSGNIIQPDTEINIADLPGGIYFLQIGDDKKRETIKFVKN